MSSNNHALIRYRTIDRCLRSQNDDYFLKDLIKACSDEVHEYEEHRSGKKKNYKSVSRRSIMYDLKFMKNEEFGFGAPIEYDRTDGYYYDDPTFEVFKTKISKSDAARMGEALSILKQLSGESNFKEIESMVTRLEETYQIKSRRNKPVVLFENSSNIDGQKWVSELAEKIRNKQAIRIDYQPFGKDKYTRVISPYLIKEYNNRWFLIGLDHEIQKMSNLGLDRLKKVRDSIKEFQKDPDFDPKNYSKDIVGVSIRPETKKTKIKIKAHGNRKFYLETKPIHASQKKIKETKNYAIFQLDVIPNYELTAKILASADTLEVTSPKSYRDAVANRIAEANKLY